VLRVTWYAVRGTWYVVRGTWYAYAVRGTAVRGTRYAVRGTRYAVRVTSYELRVTSYELVTCYVLRVTCNLPALPGTPGTPWDCRFFFPNTLCYPWDSLGLGLLLFYHEGASYGGQNVALRGHLACCLVPDPLCSLLWPLLSHPTHPLLVPLAPCFCPFACAPMRRSNPFLFFFLFFFLVLAQEFGLQDLLLLRPPLPTASRAHPRTAPPDSSDKLPSSGAHLEIRRDTPGSADTPALAPGPLQEAAEGGRGRQRARAPRRVQC